MSNRYWQVLRTYLERPRFWVLGIAYLMIICFWFWYYDWNLPAQRQGQAMISVIYGNLIACFLGLHVRRQFSHAGAQAIPGYTGPHLVVAALLCSVLWLLIPGVAIAVGRWSPGALAIHASVAILAGLVACWPRAILLVMALPIFAVWDNRDFYSKHTPLLEQLYQGDRPNLAVTLVALAVVSQVVAARMLIRLPRKGITTNDEFTLDAPAAPAGSNPLTDWLLERREGAAQRLTEAQWFSQVQRWRAPVAIAPVLLLLPPLLVGLAALVGWWMQEPVGWAAFALILCSAMLLLVPLGPWQSRRKAMSQEVLRPITREKYFRQFLGAMALDTVTWIGVASLMIVMFLLLQWLFDAPSQVPVKMLYVAIVVSLGLLWSMATFVYGVGVATMHWRFWLPIVAAITMVYFFGTLISYRVIGESILRSSRQLDQYTPHTFAAFCVTSTAIGLYLSNRTYRRWVRNDVV